MASDQNQSTAITSNKGNVRHQLEPREGPHHGHELHEIHNRIEQLERKVLELQESQIDLPFASRIKYRERLDREEFFYKAFRALSFNKINGDYVEFGSHGCTTFSLAYRQSRTHRHKAKLWAFDSFAGLPKKVDTRDEHSKWIEGTMHTSLDDFHRLCAQKEIPKDVYTVVPGFFADTLPKISAQEPPLDIALAYVDCDLYSSTVEVLKFLKPRLKHGMIIAFDDYFCWSASHDAGERVAILETLNTSEDWEFLQYLQFGWHGLAFVVLDKDL